MSAGSPAWWVFHSPGRFDRHHPVASPRSGACRRRCRRFAFLRTRRENTVQQRDATLPRRRPGSRPGERWTSRRSGSHLDQNVLGQLYAAVVLASILDPSGGLFSDAARPCQRPAPPLWRKRGTRKSGLETKTENEALFSPSSASLVTPDPAKPRQPRGKSHPSLQCHNWPDWVADGEV